MKLASSLLLPTLCAATVHVYTFDSAGRDATGSSTGVFGILASHIKSLVGESIITPRTLSPDAARVVLAQRAGATDSYGDDVALPGVLDAINEFGVQTPLFGSGDLTRIFVLAEVSDESLPPLKHASHFEVSPAPSLQSAQKLFDSLQATSNGGMEHILFQTQAASTGSRAVFSRVSTTAQELEQLWLGMLSDDSLGASISVTLVAFPKSVAQSAGDQTWARISSSQPLSKREAEPADSSGFSPVARQDNTRSSPLPGILPACFTSQAECESVTRNCTGHGSCSLSYKDATFEIERTCYSCSCSPTVALNSKGQKSTTYWGGPACQKKDISMQFWLIALFTVGMVFLVSFGVGSLWSMGEETLPSVIGAGVSGPGARK